jgi:hypothetical protein
MEQQADEDAAAVAAASAAMAAKQAVADAAAMLLALLMGLDPGEPPSYGLLLTGMPNVLIGGFPMPPWMDIARGLGKLLKGLKSHTDASEYHLTGAGETRDVDAEAGRLYDQIRADTDDVQAVAREMGVSEDVAARVKDHLFGQEHDIPTPSGMAHERFEPVREYAEEWRAAAGKGEQPLTPEQRGHLQDLLVHENVEASLHADGVPVYDPNLGFAPDDGYPMHKWDDPGAHSKAVIAERGFPASLVDKMTPEQRATMLEPMMKAALEGRGYAPYSQAQLDAMDPGARAIYQQLMAGRTQGA